MRGHKKFGLIAATAIIVVSATGIGVKAKGEAPAKGAAFFSADQVMRGEDEYVTNCVMCHGYNLNDGEFAPPIKGSFFQNMWVGKTVGELFTKTVMTMPQSNPDSLDPGTYADVLAYILHQNGIAAGDKDMPTDADALNKISLPW
jgi:mono/diheme cytochrome c family protein